MVHTARLDVDTGPCLTFFIICVVCWPVYEDACIYHRPYLYVCVRCGVICVLDMCLWRLSHRQPYWRERTLHTYVCVCVNPTGSRLVRFAATMLAPGWTWQPLGIAWRAGSEDLSNLFMVHATTTTTTLCSRSVSCITTTASRLLAASGYTHLSVYMYVCMFVHIVFVWVPCAWLAFPDIVLLRLVYYGIDQPTLANWLTQRSYLMRRGHRCVHTTYWKVLIISLQSVMYGSVFPNGENHNALRLP